MSIKEAESLVIRNLEMLEDVASLLTKENGTAQIISEKINDLIGEWCNKQNFDGQFDLWEEEVICFSPAQWKSKNDRGKDEFKAKYEFTFVENGKSLDSDSISAYFFLSPLLGIGAARAGFRFYIDHKAVKANTLGIWKSYVQSHESYTKLMKMGFELIEGCSWFVTWRLDCNVLADAYVSDNIEDALNPVLEALEKIRQAHLIFEKLVEDAEKADFNRQV